MTDTVQPAPSQDRFTAAEIDLIRKQLNEVDHKLVDYATGDVCIPSGNGFVWKGDEHYPLILATEINIQTALSDRLTSILAKMTLNAERD